MSGVKIPGVIKSDDGYSYFTENCPPSLATRLFSKPRCKPQFETGSMKLWGRSHCSSELDDNDKNNDQELPKQEVGDTDDAASMLSLPISTQEPKNPKKDISADEKEYEPISISFLDVLTLAQTLDNKLLQATMRLSLEHMQLSDLPDVMSPLSSWPAISPHSSLYTTPGSRGDEEKVFPPSLIVNELEISQTMNALMHIKETPSKLYISMQDLKDTIFHQSVNCNLLIAVVAGLPNCGKSKAIHRILEDILLTPANIHKEGSLQSYVQNGLSSYGMVIVGRKPYANLIWLPESRSSMHMFAFGSVILHNSLLQGQQVELIDKRITQGKKFKGFKEASLNTHLHRVYDDIDKLVSNSELNPEIRKIMPSGVTAVNIIDAAFNQGIYDFLTIAARYCHRQFGFIFLDLNRDVPSLNEEPYILSKEGMKKHTMLHLGSRIFYLIRFAAVSYFSTNRTSSLIVALHDGSSPDSEVEARTAALKEAIAIEIKRQNLPADLIQDVLVINLDKADDLMHYKIHLETFVKGRRSAFLDLKLTFVFLRSFLLNDSKYSQKIFVSFREIEMLSQEMSMEKSEFDDFLRTYTDFGSLLYMKDILPDIIILQPAAFANYIKKLFDPQENKAKRISEGIISMSEASQILGNPKAASVVIRFLLKSGIAVELPGRYLFIPSARPSYFDNDHDPTALCISYSSIITPPNMPGVFLSTFLKIGNFTMIPTTFQNLILLKLKSDLQLDIAFYPGLICIKLKLQKPTKHYEDVCKNILLKCIAAVSEIEVLFPDITYDFTLKCLYKETVTYECILGTSSEQHLCDQCQRAFQNKLRQHWNNAVKSIEQAKDKAVVSMETLTQIAGKMAAIKGVDDNLIMKVFSITEEERATLKSTYHSDRHVYLLSILLTWVSKIGKNNVTKQKLHNNLFRANPQFINISL